MNNLEKLKEINLGLFTKDEITEIFKGLEKYLDISINTQDAKVAREQCKQKDQIAYFDLQDFSSVEVDANATSGQH